MGTTLEGEFLEGSKRDSRKIGRERAAKRTHGITILADSSLFTEVANYTVLPLLLEEKNLGSFDYYLYYIT